MYIQQFILLYIENSHNFWTLPHPIFPRQNERNNTTTSPSKHTLKLVKLMLLFLTFRIWYRDRISINNILCLIKRPKYK